MTEEKTAPASDKASTSAKASADKPAGEEQKTEQKKGEGIKNEEVKEKTAPVSAEASASANATTDKPAGKEKEEKIEIPKKFKKLVDEIGSMSVLDLAELVKILEKKFGVSAQAPVVTASAAPVSAEATAGKEEKREEKSVFNIELKKVGDKKIEVIKLVRDITEKGLKEAKDLVDAAAESPQIVKENVKKEEAEEMKKKFTEAGAEVELN